MRLRLLGWLALAVTSALFALPAANAGSGGATQARLAAASTSSGHVSVKYTVSKFGRRGNGLVAYGTAIARYTPGSAGGQAATRRAPFTAPVRIRAAGARRLSAVETICPVLTLDLQQLDLNLLGLVVHADRVFLTLKADSEGGVLGSLLCGLTKAGKLQAQTTRLNYIVKKGRLAVRGFGFTVSPSPAVSTGGGNATPNALRPLELCPVLELTLGPLDADLLGLLVHLDQVHLTIIADSEGGILGSLFCSVAGGGTTPT